MGLGFRRPDSRHAAHHVLAAEGNNLYGTYDVRPHPEGVQRGLEIKELRDLNDLTVHDVQPMSDEHTVQS